MINEIISTTRHGGVLRVDLPDQGGPCLFMQCSTCFQPRCFVNRSECRFYLGTQHDSSLSFASYIESWTPWKLRTQLPASSFMFSFIQYELPSPPESFLLSSMLWDCPLDGLVKGDAGAGFRRDTLLLP